MGRRIRGSTVVLFIEKKHVFVCYVINHFDIIVPLSVTARKSGLIAEPPDTIAGSSDPVKPTLR